MKIIASTTTGALLASLVLGTAPAQAGPYILAGTDADDHGYVSGGANRDGWLFMQRAIESLAPGVTNGSKVVVSLGSDPNTQAGNAALSAFNLSGLAAQGYSFQSVNGAAAISSFLSAGSLTAAAVIMLDSGGNVSGGLTTAEESAIAANAGNLNSFLGAGGGLFSQANSYGFLSLLVPGIVVSFFEDQNIALTPAGAAAFPNLTNQDLSAGPYHANFSNIGPIPVLGTGVGADSNRNLIIGASTGTITNPGNPTPVPEPASLALFGAGLLGLGVVRRRRGA